MIISPERKFQSTLPHGERRHVVTGHAWQIFQSTLPHGERHRLLVEKMDEWYQDFNPRSHTGSDAAADQISIDTEDFNPRSHTGSDMMAFIALQVGDISIHAPTRGAT